MENPATWTEVEKTIHEASSQWFAAREAGYVGGSLAMSISNALRAHNFIVDDERTRRTNDNPVQRAFDR